MPFRVPKIKGCCCLSLETGSKVIGCLHTFTTSAAYGVGILQMFFVLALSFPILFAGSWGSSISILQAMIYESLFLNFGWCAVSMLYGSVKKDHVMMFPWIILHTVFLVFLLNTIFIQVVYYGLMDIRADAMLLETIISLVHGYTLMIVYNHYRELKELRPEATS